MNQPVPVHEATPSSPAEETFWQQEDSIEVEPFIKNVDPRIDAQVQDGSSSWKLRGLVSVCILFVAILLGMITAGNRKLAQPWRLFSNCLGYFYTICWTLDGYPQLIKNALRRDTSGLAVDYLFLNFIGFAAWTVYNVAMLLDEDVRRAFRSRNGGRDPLVEPHDALFAFHSLVLTGGKLVQCWYYNGSEQQPHWLCVALCTMLLGIPCLWAALIRGLSLDLLILLSYEKVLVSAVKYPPQIFKHYAQKSTHGWAIDGTLLDIVGGLSSASQLVVDAAASGDTMNGILGDLPKMALGLLSVMLAFPQTPAGQPVSPSRLWACVHAGRKQGRRTTARDQTEIGELAWNGEPSFQTQAGPFLCATLNSEFVADASNIAYRFCPFDSLATLAVWLVAELAEGRQGDSRRSAPHHHDLHRFRRLPRRPLLWYLHAVQVEIESGVVPSTKAPRVQVQWDQLDRICSCDDADVQSPGAGELEYVPDIPCK
eukprot:scaffold435_cov285-Pinguiococcus_pyrenoidosus.AAC.4